MRLKELISLSLSLSLSLSWQVGSFQYCKRFPAPRNGLAYLEVGDVPEMAERGQEVESGDPLLSNDENEEDLGQML